MAALATGPLVWGVNGHPLTAYRDVPVAQQIDLVAALGMRAYRVDVSSLDQIDALATLIAAAKVRHIVILPVLIPPVDFEHQSAAQIYDIARRYAERFVERFKSDVNVWELGNEQENYALIHPCEKRDDGTIYPCNWGAPAGTIPLDYQGDRVAKVAAFLRGLSDGVHSIDPTARRAIGSAGWGHIGIFDRLKAENVSWDISVWHLYGTDFEWALKRLHAFGKPIWITEFDHPFGSAKQGEAGQADGLRAMTGLLKGFADQYDIEGAFVYELIDETYWSPSFEASMGLVRLDAVPGGGWRLGGRKAAFGTVAGLLAGNR